jgi:hypothetical protein
MRRGIPFSNAAKDEDNEHNRRELFVAAVACQTHGVKSNSILNMAEIDGKWLKFHMTENIPGPNSDGGVTIVAEFIEEVTDKDDEHFRKVIQLYE